MGVKAPAEKNFRRPKVKPGRGKKSPRRFRIGWRAVRSAVTLALVAYAVYVAGTLVANASVLRVGRVTVQGNVRLSRGEVEHMVHDLYGTNILTADLARFRRVLLDSPWVADVTLRRVLPSTIEVAVTERRPFGISRLGGQLYLIDRDGRIIDEFGPQYAEFDLPIVDGLVRAPGKGRPVIDEGRVELAARLIESLQANRDLAARVSQIDVSRANDAVVLLDGDPALLHLGEQRFRERLESYLEVAPALRERVPEIDYVDLRFEERLYVKPRGRAAGPIDRPAPVRKRF